MNSEQVKQMAMEEHEGMYSDSEPWLAPGDEFFFKFSQEPLAKQPKLEDKATLLYFGLSFIWEEMVWKVPPTRIGFDEVDQDLQDLINNDIRRLGNVISIYNTSSVEFTCVNGTNIFVFMHSGFCSCTGVTLADISRQLCIDKMQYSGLDACSLTGIHSHVTLEPFFCDNAYLLKLYKHLNLDDARQLETLEDSMTTSQMDDRFYTGGPLYTPGHQFTDATWSKRLSGCLKEFLPRKFDVKLTYHLGWGKDFILDQSIYSGLPSEAKFRKCYPFHGTPELMIKERPVVLSQPTDASSEENDTIMENSYQLNENLGELFANLHVSLVKKVLRAFLKKKRYTEHCYKIRGLLVNKMFGCILCEVKVDLKCGGASPIKLFMDDDNCHVLDPGSLCFHLQRLLDSPIHNAE